MRQRNFKFVTLTSLALLILALTGPAQAGWASNIQEQADSGLQGISILSSTPLPSIEDIPLPPNTPNLIDRAVVAGEIDEQTAYLYLAYALSNDPRLPEAYRGSAPWDGTLPLLRLREAARDMPAGEIRGIIEAVLTGACSSSTGGLGNIRNSTHFHIQYGTFGAGLTIDDYVTSLEGAWDKEINDFGWAAPPVLASNPPPGNRYHVRIDNLGSGLYGFVSSSGAHAGFVGDNPNTAWNDQDAYASCMALNRDYSGFPSTPQASLDSTTAHEFNHSIQFGIGALTGQKVPDDSFVEGGATWMEDEVYDSANDNYNYLWPSFTRCMGQYTLSPYPYWITFRGMLERFNAGAAGGSEEVMQDFWELTSQGISGNLVALNTALANKGASLAGAYHNYAIAVKFNKACSGGYGYPYCLEEGPQYVAAQGATSLTGSIAAVGGNYNGNVQDNYALNWVGLPISGYYNVTVENNSGGGQLRASVVCNTGTSLIVSPLLPILGAGQEFTLHAFNSSGCTQVVAVITNQAQTAENPSTCTSRSYQLRTETATFVGYIPFIPYDTIP